MKLRVSFIYSGMQITPKKSIETYISLKKSATHKLVLHNDDYNSIEHIVMSLVEICNHDIMQADQCATIAHHKGMCDVKLGVESVLKEMMVEFLLRKITVTVEINE